MITSDTILGDAAGRPSVSGAAPVYLLHGLLGSCAAHFAGQMEAWQGRYELIPFDLPGHGASAQDAGRPYYATAVELLAHRMGEHGPGHVIGLSYLGGSVALRCALAHPDLFCSLVLSGYIPEVPETALNTWADAFQVLARQNPSLAQKYERLSGARWERTLKTIRMEIREEYATSIAVRKDMLAELRVPTLLLNGSLRSDERQAAVDMPRYSPLIDAGLVPGAGHIASHDQPDIFNRIVETFWNRTQGRNHAAATT